MWPEQRAPSCRSEGPSPTVGDPLHLPFRVVECVCEVRADRLARRPLASRSALRAIAYPGTAQKADVVRLHHSPRVVTGDFPATTSTTRSG